jgi:hypothetical protein
VCSFGNRGAEPSRTRNKEWLTAPKQRVFSRYAWATQARNYGSVNAFICQKFFFFFGFFGFFTRKKDNFFFICFFQKIFVRNRLPPLLNAPTDFEPNLSSHLGVVRALSPDTQDLGCVQGDISFPYLKFLPSARIWIRRRRRLVFPRPGADYVAPGNKNRSQN